jgi:hypothetical protein
VRPLRSSPHPSGISVSGFVVLFIQYFPPFTAYCITPQASDASWRIYLGMKESHSSGRRGQICDEGLQKRAFLSAPACLSCVLRCMECACSLARSSRGLLSSARRPWRWFDDSEPSLSHFTAQQRIYFLTAIFSSALFYTTNALVYSFLTLGKSLIVYSASDFFHILLSFLIHVYYRVYLCQFGTFWRFSPE